MKKAFSLLLVFVMLISTIPMTALATEGSKAICNHTYESGVCTVCGEVDPNALAGKTISILGASISTYAGTSNGSAADTTNSTIRNNVKYYPNTTIPEVTLDDTWWMQVTRDLGLRLLVNNAWSGSAILLERSGTVGAYVDRCVQLHDNTGDNAGEEPDIICVQMGFNDFSYGKDTLGTADIDYDTLITANGYGTPTTTMEATAIMLDKMVKRYPNAEIYMFNHFKRIGQSASDTALMEQLNASIATVCARFGVTVVDLYTSLTEPSHIGDGRLHPNRLGMDTISEAVKKAIITHTDYAVETHNVTLNLNGVTADYVDNKIMVSGDSFSCSLTAEYGKELSVSVSMGGEDITDAAYENGTVSIESVTADVVIAAEATDIDLFVFAGQSNMMGASVLEPEVDTFTDKSLEYKYVPKLRGEATGTFVSAQNPAGEFYYNDLTAAYGDKLNDLDYKSSLSNYSANTYFCPAMRDSVKGFSAQSEADTYPAASLAPYFVTEYAEYGHSSVYAHMAKGSNKIVDYFTEEMVDRYNTLIREYNDQNGKAYSTLSVDSLSGAGNAFNDKYNAMVEDYAAFAPDNTVKNKCFVWLQGESDGSSYIKYKLKMQVLWEYLQELGFTHFFVLRVGYWGNTGILNVIKAQEDFCAENDNCYIVTRAPSLIPHPTATTDNWWINEPSEEYDSCRDSYLVNSSNNHFNEKAMQIFAERSAANVHRILHQGLEPVLEEENIQGMIEEKPEVEAPEDTTPYTTYIGTEVFRNGLSISNKSNVWKECTSSSAASTDLVPVKSTDSVWLQYVFFLSEAHAVGGFYDEEGKLVAPLYYKDFGFTLGGGSGEAAFKTPAYTNRVSIADVEAITGQKIAFVRFTAWKASKGGYANTEARIYHAEEHTHTYENGTCTVCGENEPHTHTYTPTVTPPTCTEQGYTTYTCECGDSYVDSYVPAKGHFFGKWIVTTAPTCTATGTERRDCDACDHYETRTVNALGHTYGEDDLCIVCGKYIVTEPTLLNIDGVWYYYENGLKTATTTLVKYQGKWFYIQGGKWNSKMAEGLYKYNGVYFWIKSGKWDSKIEDGLYKHSGKWFYINNGKWASTKKGIIKHEGKDFYVTSGKWDSKKTTLYKKDGKYYAIKSGKWYKGKNIIKYNGKKYYVNKGYAQTSFSGKTTINGKKCTVKKGIIK